MLKLRALGWGAKRIAPSWAAAATPCASYLRRGGWQPMT